MTADALPSPDLTLRPDRTLRRLNDGRTLLGGTPLRLLRLKPAGATAAARLLDGEPPGPSRGRRQLARRLLSAGLAHPVPAGPGPFGPVDVTVVVPVLNDEAGVEALVGRLGVGRVMEVDDGSGPPTRAAEAQVGRVIVVDDGSTTPIRAAGTQVVRRDSTGGPAAARNTGLEHVRTPLVAFVDADARPDPGWLEHLLPHFADPAVAVVAPRVRSARGAGRLARYEEHRSPLDLGDIGALVRPRGRVAYVPATAIVARTDVVRNLGGFATELRWGEDVDLVWRLVEAGHIVRYEPAATVAHRPRSRLAAWVRQRVSYGTAAAPLSLRHPGAVPPVAVSAWSALAWLLVALRRPLAGLAVAAASAAFLPRKLTPMGVPREVALGLAARGHLGAGRWLAAAVTRPWWPFALAAAATCRRLRPAVLAAAVVPAAVDWCRTRPSVDPASYVGLRIADDLAYGAGVWLGCARSRTLAPLKPDLASWPGRSSSQIGSVDRS